MLQDQGTEEELEEGGFEAEGFDDSENVDELSEVEYTKEPTDQEVIIQEPSKE